MPAIGTNEQRSAAEVAAFIADEPVRYFAYWFSAHSGQSKAYLYRGYKIGTWMEQR